MSPIGSTIQILNGGGLQSYAAGDNAVIVAVDNYNNCWVDFRSSGNANVVQPGVWVVGKVTDGSFELTGQTPPALQPIPAEVEAWIEAVNTRSPD